MPMTRNSTPWLDRGHLLRMRCSSSRPTTCVPPPTSSGRFTIARVGWTDGCRSRSTARSAHDSRATINEARRLLTAIERRNVFVKIPATLEGLEAITAAVAVGTNVNVTLIFGLDRYRAVIDAYLTGLERAHAGGGDLSSIRSVASFFVSRVDTEIDRRLSELGSTDALNLRGAAGIANARLAYEIFLQEFDTDRARRLLALGAHRQRPLWASTGVKDPTRRDTRYVEELVAAGAVSTMPERTLEAVFEHGVIRGDTVTHEFGASRGILDELAAVGISYDDVTGTLEREGVAKFVASGQELESRVTDALVRFRGSGVGA